MNIRTNKKIAAFAGCLSVALLTTAALAEESSGRPKSGIDVIGGGFLASANTTVRLDSADGRIGTTLDFEDDLGIDDSDLLLFLGASWRFAHRHRLEFEWFELGRDGRRELQAEIRFGEDVFNVGAEVNTFFDTDVFRVGYAYSFVRDDRKEVGLHVGVHITDLATGLRAKAVLGENEALEGLEFAEVTAPLPVIGIQGVWQFARKWSLIGRAQIFRLEIDDYDGALNHLKVGVVHSTFKHVGFGFGFDYFEVDVDMEDPNFSGSVDFDYGGPIFFVLGHF